MWRIVWGAAAARFAGTGVRLPYPAGMSACGALCGGAPAYGYTVRRGFLQAVALLGVCSGAGRIVFSVRLWRRKRHDPSAVPAYDYIARCRLRLQASYSD